MNFFSKAWTRFYEWLYHPSFRYHKTSKAFVIRYPSPASLHIPINVHDYKKPYTHSFYNVRFRKLTIHQAIPQSSQFAMDALVAPTIQEKLIQAGLLNKENQNNKEAVDAAKTEWFKKYKIPVEQRIAKNDFKWKIPDPNNPQTFRYLNDMRTKVNLYEEKMLRGDDNLDRIHGYRVPQTEWCCYYAGDPEFQQMLIEVLYTTEGFERSNIQRGEVPVFSANRNFWKALDSINDSDNVLRVESHINDPAPLDFSLNNQKSANKSVKIKKDKEGEVRIQFP